MTRHRKNFVNSSMPYSFALFISVVFLLVSICAQSQAQNIEPGLERAVKWKWNVAPPANASWGLPLREVPVIEQRSVAQPANAALAPQLPQNIYTVKKGDVLIHIAKKLRLSVAQIKEFNALDTDFLKIGQELRIPSPEEIPLLKSTPKTAAAQPSAAAAPAEIAKSEVLLLRVFLDNQGFGSGPISDTPDPVFGKVLNLYQTGRGEMLEHPVVVQRAKESVLEPLIFYTLHVEDFRFIAPPKAARAVSEPRGKTNPAAKPAPTPAPTYQELVTADFLAYRSPWEFVAERFHCDEAFLRKLNPSLGTQPAAGSRFRVPNVQPFEIEKIPATGLQPVADPAQPLTATINDMTTLEISRNGRLIAVMPIGRARPGLRGRGKWRIMDAIGHPRLATFQEDRVIPVEKNSPFYTNPNPTPIAVRPVLSQEQYLPPGPNNPAGVVWINLAKGDETIPQPFGLHGCSTPMAIQTLEGLGGFRLTNWDILRAARLLPAGTKLDWKP
jgi:LysM repeat protein/lipoprotein-anchoring transpeptidase ErfK/SrfK